ncbi:MAG: hypothetical protein ABIV26_03240 [Candidatus Limnocylindrales bacterium]
MIALSLVGCAPAGVASPSPTGAGIVAEVASYQLVAGRPGRLLIAILTGDGRWLSFGSVQVQFRYLGDGSGNPPAGPMPTAAPMAAKFLPIPGTPEASSAEPILTLPADGRGVFAVEPITFPVVGFWEATTRGRLDGVDFEAAAAFNVLDHSGIVAVGDRAPHTDNPVIGSVGIPSFALDSRAAGDTPIPDEVLHATSIAGALDRGHPAIVVFSTPVYCVSRFCGPVTDLVADLAAKYGDRADFIHVEIYRDFQAGLVSQAALDWLQPDTGDLREPWTFLVGADGIVAGSWDTVVTRSELEPLLDALPPKRP